MRKYIRKPQIHGPTKERNYYWFRITDSYGKKPVYRFGTEKEAKDKLKALVIQLERSLCHKQFERIEIESAIDFYLKDKKDLPGVVRYYDYKRNFLGFANEKGIRFIDEVSPETIREYMLWRQSYGMRKAKQRRSQSDY